MRQFHLDIGDVEDKEGLYEVLVAALPLPSYFGRNLDALYDVLTEYGADWQIEISGMQAAEAAMPQYMQKFRHVLWDAASETEGLEIRYLPDGMPMDEASMEETPEEDRSADEGTTDGRLEAPMDEAPEHWIDAGSGQEREAGTTKG